jgi:hypothetical protein
VLLASSASLPLSDAQDTQQPQNEPAQTVRTPQNNKSDQKPPETPQPQKDENANPAQAMRDKTKEVAKEGFRKVRDWEVGVIAGTYVGRNRQLVPLTGRQREYLYLQETWTTPTPYMKRLFEAGIDQARDAPAQWGEGWGGYGKRFASREGQFLIANTFAAWGNAKLGYEPRYEECRCSGLWPRARHAIARNFYTYDRTEMTKRPQWALYGGALGAGMISASWQPEHNVGNQAVLGVVGQAAWGTVLNLFIEFAPDINRKLGAKKR